MLIKSAEVYTSLSVKRKGIYNLRFCGWKNHTREISEILPNSWRLGGNQEFITCLKKFAYHLKDIWTMQHSFENIPNHFEQIEKQNFDRLTNERKREVLVYFSRRNINELRRNLTGYKVSRDTPARNEQLKKAALAFYDSRHSQKKPPLLLWQAAAVVLLLFMWLAFYMWSKTGNTENKPAIGSSRHNLYTTTATHQHGARYAYCYTHFEVKHFWYARGTSSRCKPVSAPANGSVEILTLEEHRKISASAPETAWKTTAF